eukprot:scaffold467646_cov17-Prasinocladus_malaysianus.AAC.1
MRVIVRNVRVYPLAATSGSSAPRRPLLSSYAIRRRHCLSAEAARQRKRQPSSRGKAEEAE